MAFGRLNYCVVFELEGYTILFLTVTWVANVKLTCGLGSVFQIMHSLHRYVINY